MTSSQCPPAEAAGRSGTATTVAVRPVPLLPAQERRGPPALVTALRPKQWLKNVLVFAAPIAAGAGLHPTTLTRVFFAFWLFTAASAATYLLNDVIDREADRLHPVKRHRPVASGRVAVKPALSVAAALAVISVAGALWLDPVLALTISSYMAISTGYTLWLKRIAVVELACVASGFTLRAVAGAVVAHATSSPWFLVMVSFGALFIVAGKRRSEQIALGDTKTVHRRSLGAYPADFLRNLRAVAMSVTVTMYCLWAFQRASDLSLGRGPHLVWFELSIVPFVLAVLLVELAVQKGRGGEPEDLALSDHALQLCGLAWAALVTIGIYA